MERLRDVDEASLLARLFPVYARAVAEHAEVLVGPGDDAAVLATPGGSVVATTDGMVRDRDWRDHWSSGHDVGVKVAVSNVADVAAMGAWPTGLLVSLVADPDTPLEWALDLARGIATVAEEVGAPVLGGDLSSGPPGVVAVTVTALGDLAGRRPVLRSGARPGDLVAVCGTLGRSGGGLRVLLQDLPRSAPAERLVRAHLAPSTPWRAGPEAAAAGAHALVDVSDGLVTDLARVARASRVDVDLDAAVLRERFAAGELSEVLGAAQALEQVLAGGEEHALVGCFPASAGPGDGGWVVVGRVTAPAGEGGVLTVDGSVPSVRGWDHFAGG